MVGWLVGCVVVSSERPRWQGGKGPPLTPPLRSGAVGQAIPAWASGREFQTSIATGGEGYSLFLFCFVFVSLLSSVNFNPYSSCFVLQFLLFVPHVVVCILNSPFYHNSFYFIFTFYYLVHALYSLLKFCYTLFFMPLPIHKHNQKQGPATHKKRAGF